MTTITEPHRQARVTTDSVERYGRAVRWFHAFVYTTVLIALATGWWLLIGREGDPSPLARLTGLADASLHKLVGSAFAAGSSAGIVVGLRATRTFVNESLRFDRGDTRWFTHWPSALMTGRFEGHKGHFDPGQRVANLLIVAVLTVLVGSGLGLIVVHGGSTFVWLALLHRWSTYVLVPVILGHVLIASGLFPGYRGVWRSMHLGGRLPTRMAKRLWPAWLERTHRRRSS
jgi:cytochrome b subunit of formate dehydrogenase